MLVFLIGLSWFVPYPEVVTAKISIDQKSSRSDQGVYSIQIPFQYISTIKVGQKVLVQIEGIPGELEGRVDSISDQVVVDNKKALLETVKELKPIMKFRNDIMS